MAKKETNNEKSEPLRGLHSLLNKIGRKESSCYFRVKRETHRKEWHVNINYAKLIVI